MPVIVFTTWGSVWGWRCDWLSSDFTPLLQVPVGEVGTRATIGRMRNVNTAN